MENSQEYVDILIDTLRKQTEVLKDVLQITKEQSDIIKQDDFDEMALEYTLNQKEILIAKLNELDEGFVSVYDRVRRQVRENQEQYREQIASLQNLIKQCTDLGMEIKVLETRNRERIAQCFAGKQKQFGAAKTAASVASNYHRVMHRTNVMGSTYMDSKQ